MTSLATIAVLAAMLATAIALAHIMDPFILILLFSRLFTHAFMHSLVRADVGPQLYTKILSIFVTTQIPVIIVAVVLIVKLSSANDMILNINYIERKWFIITDFLLILLGAYTMIYI